MYRHAFFVAALLSIALSAPALIEAQEVDGTWKLTYLSGGTVEVSTLLVKLKTVDGMITGEEIASNGPLINNPNRTVSIQQEGNLLRIRVSASYETVFEAAIPKAQTKKWLGCYTRSALDRKFSYPAWLTPTKETKLDFEQPRRGRTHICPPMQEAAELNKNAQAKKFGRPDADAVALAKKETPRLYREVLAKFPDDPAAFQAVLGLLKSAQENKATLEEVKGWGAVADKMAKMYGPAFENGFAAQAVAALEGQEAYAVVSVDYARRVERTLTAKTPAQDQIDVLEPFGRALRKAGKDEEAKKVTARIARLEDSLDQEYLATLPAVKEFAGRKSKSKRAVLLEQFTHSDSGPGNFDRACSMLLRTYKPSELVLAQYCVYGDYYTGDGPVIIAGLLSNRDAEARFANIRKAFPSEIRSGAWSLFNGFPKRGGKGLDGTYRDFREIIEPMLEEDAGAELAVRAVRSGDKIDIQVNVSGLAKPSADKKLRILLVEDALRVPGQKYTGKGEVRLHHNIVRAYPGGIAGKSLTEADTKYNVTVSITDLRAELAKYLKYTTDRGRPLKDIAPLLALERLRVVAFVQDDNTREVLQAVQVEVKDK